MPAPKMIVWIVGLSAATSLLMAHFSKTAAAAVGGSVSARYGR